MRAHAHRRDAVVGATVKFQVNLWKESGLRDQSLPAIQNGHIV